MEDSNSLDPRLGIKNGAAKIVDNKITDHISEDCNFFRQGCRIIDGNGVFLVLTIRSHCRRIEGTRKPPRSTVDDLEARRDERRGVEGEGSHCWMRWRS